MYYDSQIMSKVKNQHDAGISDDVDKDVRPEPSKKSNEFLFFSNATAELLMNGIKINLNLSLDQNQCKQVLLKELSPYYEDINQMDIVVYFTGGVPFLRGTLNDFYAPATKQGFQRYIYGILIKKLDAKNSDLNEIVYSICDVSDEIHKELISPLYNSTEKGLCDMACLLGYLNNFGAKGKKLLKCVAATIRFPPLITSLRRIIDRNKVMKRDIVTVCASFHTYFMFLINSVTPPEQIFEYALRCCNIITHIQNIPKEKLPIICVDMTITSGSKNISYLDNFKELGWVYLWEPDMEGIDFNYVKLKQSDPKGIEDANKSFASFSPIAPLSIRSVKQCSIIKGKDHSFLYTTDSSVKGSTDLINILDPLIGKAKQVNIEDFAREQNNDKIDDVANLIDPDKVEQIIMVCFDQSGSMRENLEGNEPAPDEPSRITIATQYLTSFVNKTYGYRVPCILGLISFNDELIYRCPLSPLIPDFEDKGLKGIEAGYRTHLWDVIVCATNELIEFSQNEKLTNATKRIIVISDGEDVDSQCTLIDAAKAVFDNKIILDSILISNTSHWKELAVVSHISGGIALKPNDINEGMFFFELDAFQNVKLRENSSVNPIIKGDRRTTTRRLKSDMITDDFIQKAKDCVEIDTEIPNKQIRIAIRNRSLSTPEHACSICKQESEPRRRRILRELHYTSLVTNKELETYDPDLVVYTFDNIDKWQVFLKSPQESKYLGKWFSILVTFPELYPIEAPFIQFITVPYNLNISSEGRICLDILEKGYIPSLHVVDVLQQIKFVFLLETVELPVRLDVYETFLHDRDEYNRKATESAHKNGKDKVEDFLPSNYKIESKVENDFKFVFGKDDKVPSYMKSQISGRVYKDPVLVPSVNQMYEREEIKKIVAENQDPTCVVTGLPITESLKDIDALKRILI